MNLMGHEDSYLAVDEAGGTSYPEATTRVYHGQEQVPEALVSLQHKISLVVQGDFLTQITFKYELCRYCWRFTV